MALDFTDDESSAGTGIRWKPRQRAGLVPLAAGAPDPVFNDTLHLDLSTVVASLAGPKRPQDRINLPDVKNFWTDWGRFPHGRDRDHDLAGYHSRWKRGDCGHHNLHQHFEPIGDDRCRAAGEKGGGARVDFKPWVKTRLAPGSAAVMDYLHDAGSLEPLEALKFNLVGFGCTTCIGNRRPSPDEVAAGVTKEKLTVAAVLSGNRNFEGRVNPLVKANYLLRRHWRWRTRWPGAWTSI